MIGYKIFNKDWKCLDKQYSCPGIFEEDVKLDLCEQGMHFCSHIEDCFMYYLQSIHTLDKYGNSKDSFHICIVESLGDLVQNISGTKYCTNKLSIIRELTRTEFIDYINLARLSCISQFYIIRCNEFENIFGTLDTDKLLADYFVILYNYFKKEKEKLPQKLDAHVITWKNSLTNEEKDDILAKQVQNYIQTHGIEKFIDRTSIANIL